MSSSGPGPFDFQDAPAPSTTPAVDQVVGSLGDISFTPLTINVPGRSLPMAGSIWTLRDQSRVETRIPPWAIVLAIVFAFACLLGLLFLLVKETTTVGYVEVEVRTPGDYHVCQVPVSSPEDIMAVRRMVDYARTLSAWAGGQGG